MLTQLKHTKKSLSKYLTQTGNEFGLAVGFLQNTNANSELGQFAAAQQQLNGKIEELKITGL